MKTAWILGAGFVSVLLVVLALLAFSATMGSVENLASGETADGIDVPRIGTVGDFPAPAHRHVVNVAADGRIVLGGTTLSFPELVEELRRRGAATPGQRIPGTDRVLSDAPVVIRADGALPWGSAQRVIQACAEADIWRVSFAVRHDGDGSEGTLGFPIPMDKGCEDPEDIAWKAIEVEPGAGGGSAPALFAALAEFPSSLTGKLGARMEIDLRVPTRTALAMIDAAVRAGAARVELSCVAIHARNFTGFEAEVQRWRKADTGVTVRLDSGSVAANANTPAMPAVARRHGDVSVPSVQFSEWREPEAPPEILGPSPIPPVPDQPK